MTDEDHEDGVRRRQCLSHIRANIDYDGGDTILQGTTAEATDLFEELGLMTEDSSSSSRVLVEYASPHKQYQGLACRYLSPAGKL